jgi:uncharacterized protein YcbK (DUF882 family)
MEKVELNKEMKLSEHFTLGELTKTSIKTEDQNIPSRVAIENLKNLCENWLEDLRYSYNTLYSRDSPQDTVAEPAEAQGPSEGIIINSGYRSSEVNKRAGGSATSNHLTGCAVDIRVTGFEQAIRYASILLDISDGTKRDYDELYIERNSERRYWIHFAVRPKDNRRKGNFILT